ncbi:hypothetical protein E8D34_09395 [Nocardioides sp. GY 10113]|uniref:hypothetical protein n=1 Tax=Nocardioides sp. GY 10113 TaxID=2569761 RepID=UPI0010A8C72D|nr:hypothetical protein [Nocardioides sp. GY 10113]TIC87345.1 hypothetical protein E8D34_09395 [Nocardioides sp. GY 10113]
MIGHLGPRVSALLDGQLSAAEAEEAWSHVYACHACRDLVEREGWVKTRLAGLTGDGRETPSSLKGSLLSLTPGEEYLAASAVERRRGITTGVVLVGGGAVGAAILGVLALGAIPGSTPADRRPPASQINNVVTPTAPGPQPASPAPRSPEDVASEITAPARDIFP